MGLGKRMLVGIFLNLVFHPQDLLAATRKSMAAGMGEWDLQSLDWGHPEFRQHLLKVREGGPSRRGTMTDVGCPLE